MRDRRGGVRGWFAIDAKRWKDEGVAVLPCLVGTIFGRRLDCETRSSPIRTSALIAAFYLIFVRRQARRSLDSAPHFVDRSDLSLRYNNDFIVKPDSCI